MKDHIDVTVGDNDEFAEKEGGIDVTVSESDEFAGVGCAFHSRSSAMGG